MDLKRANKRHRCYECHKPIEKGELYISNARWEKRPARSILDYNKNEKWHLLCASHIDLELAYCSQQAVAWGADHLTPEGQLRAMGFEFDRDGNITLNPFDGVQVAEKKYAEDKQTRREVRERRANVESASRNSGAQIANNQPISTERPQ